MLSQFWSWIGRTQSSLEDSEPPAAATDEPAGDNVGLFTLNAPAEDTDYNIDIVAIHGLGGDPKGTWTDNNGKLWLRDFLPAEIPNARVLSFGYNSSITFSKSVTDITNAAEMLLDRLDCVRSGVAGTRPIIFVSHSLGGIIVKKVRLCSKSRGYR